MHLLVATTNQNKLREIRALLTGVPVTLHSLAELPPVVEPDETGETFQDNARLKAHYYARHLSTCDPPWAASALTVAEDSGLVIDALDGEPGVRSARYLREDASYAERFTDIYRRLTAVPEAARSARFVCALVAMRGHQVAFETVGTIEGLIAPAPSGSRGFGYDPIFLFPPDGRTLADVDDDEKLRVAHRGQAFRSVVVGEIVERRTCCSPFHHPECGRGRKRFRPGIQGRDLLARSVFRLVGRTCTDRPGRVDSQLSADLDKSDRTNAPSRVRNKNFASTSAPSNVSQAARSSPHSRCACAVVSRSPGISMYSPWTRRSTSSSA
jgi:XTP/dITP diphosphohydrolase